MRLPGSINIPISTEPNLARVLRDAFGAIYGDLIQGRHHLTILNAYPSLNELSEGETRIVELPEGVWLVTKVGQNFFQVQLTQLEI